LRELVTAAAVALIGYWAWQRYQQQRMQEALADPAPATRQSDAAKKSAIALFMSGSPAYAQTGVSSQQFNELVQNGTVVLN
jgi:hypothetical protein